MESMYEFLMDLPLLKGVSYERLSQILGSTRFHFLKYASGDDIISAGDECTHLKFVIKGAVRLSTLSPDGRMRVSQTIQTSDVIMPDFLFGRYTHYPCSGVAIGPTSILQISKMEYMKILATDQVFMLNLLNYLSIDAQKSVIGVLALAGGTLEERIAFWIVALTQRTATDITLQCKQRDFYSMFGVQRSSFVATLDSMKERGLLDYDTREIRFHSRTELAKLLTDPRED